MSVKTTGDLHEPPPRISVGQVSNTQAAWVTWDGSDCLGWQLQVGLEDPSDIYMEVPAVKMSRLAWMEDEQEGLAVEAAEGRRRDGKTVGDAPWSADPQALGSCLPPASWDTRVERQQPESESS